ncbi:MULTISPECIES: PAQR family membrane homeostasis protein TrhA [Clostridium]|uniref:PAQR family membrane homeostasis protein TrhA n=1 Tax=Clostridium TaxID=1485 RepID=UPI000824C4F5|nr:MULTISPECIES: hemolysin III family protein [Clostridium]PJI07454.1 hemolysin [Clostridium sp. CT7]
MLSKLKDPVSGLTHLAGAVLSVIALIFMIYHSISLNSKTSIVASLVFGFSLILLYSASASYHLINVSKKITAVLRRIDHMMIFVLIAGTYTPICLITLTGKTGNIILFSIWAVAILGIVLKLVWFNAPRWLYTLFYIAMGWLVVFAFAPISKIMALPGIVFMVLGGIVYSLGGVIYALKWPIRNGKYFGFHEIFHIFVMAGSAFHFIMIYSYVL